MCFIDGTPRARFEPKTSNFKHEAVMQTKRYYVAYDAFIRF